LASIENDSKSTSQIELDYLPQEKGKLFVLSIGVPDASGRLKYTQKDARDFANLFMNQKNSLYSEVEETILTSYDSTKAEVIAANINNYCKRKLRGFNSKKDAFILFLSSHGYEDENKKFRIQCSNFNEDSKRLTTIDYIEDIINELKNLDCKKYVFVDACKSGSVIDEVIGRKDVDFSYSTALEKINNSSNDIRIVSSCSKEEYSYEDDKWENGAFTKGLKEILSNINKCKELDVNKDNTISLKELIPALQLKVSKMVLDTKGKLQNPTMPKIQEFEDVPLFGIQN
jgi:hypothetical protein